MVAHGPEEQRANHEAEHNALVVLGDRLFIADKVKEMGLYNRWINAVNELNTSGHSRAFGRTVGEMFNEIAKAAREVID